MKLMYRFHLDSGGTVSIVAVGFNEAISLVPKELRDRTYKVDTHEFTGGGLQKYTGVKESVKNS